MSINDNEFDFISSKDSIELGGRIAAVQKIASELAEISSALDGHMQKYMDFSEGVTLEAEIDKEQGAVVGVYARPSRFWGCEGIQDARVAVHCLDSIFCRFYDLTDSGRKEMVKALREVISKIENGD